MRNGLDSIHNHMHSQWQSHNHMHSQWQSHNHMHSQWQSHNHMHSQWQAHNHMHSQWQAHNHMHSQWQAHNHMHSQWQLCRCVHNTMNVWLIRPVVCKRISLTEHQKIIMWLLKSATDWLRKRTYIFDKFLFTSSSQNIPLLHLSAHLPCMHHSTVCWSTKYISQSVVC